MFVRIIHDENMNRIHIERRVQIDFIFAKIKDKLDIEITLLEILKKFIDLTNENKTYELFNHKSNNHAINLKSNRKSFFDFIYFLSEDELKILRICLNKHFKNDFIRFSTFSTEIFIFFVKKKNEILRLCVNYRDLNLLTIKNRYSVRSLSISLSTAKRKSVWRLSMTKSEKKTCLSSENKSFVIITLQYICWNFFVELAIKLLTFFHTLFLTIW